MNPTCKHNFKGNKKISPRPLGMTDVLSSNNMTKNHHKKGDRRM